MHKQDTDELCVFWAGHIGWRQHSYCLGKVGNPAKVKGQPNARKTLTLNITTTAFGQMRCGLVLAKAADFGIDSDFDENRYGLRT